MAALLMAQDTEARGTLPVSVGTADTRALYMGSSADGTRGFFRTREQLTADDTDNQEDIYERIENITTLLSKGPTGGNGAVNSFYLGSSSNGLKVFMFTAERWTAADTDGAVDIYERSGGTTTLLSTGPSGSGAGDMIFKGASVDGTRVFFESPTPLIASDTDDNIDVYERSGGVTTLISTGPLDPGGSHAFFKGVSETAHMSCSRAGHGSRPTTPTAPIRSRTFTSGSPAPQPWSPPARSTRTAPRTLRPAAGSPPTGTTSSSQRRPHLQLTTRTASRTCTSALAAW